MIGQFFVVKRYLEAGKRPKAVIYIGINPMGKNLESPWAEVYIKHVFLRFSEIGDLARVARDLRFSVGMLLYKFLPSYRAREVIRKWAHYDPEAPIAGRAPTLGPSHSILSMMGSWLEPKPDLDLSKKYFEKLLDLLADNHIDFYFVQVGLSQTNYNHWWHTAGFEPNPLMPTSGEQLEAYLSSTAKRYPGFRFSRLSFPVYPDDYFDAIRSPHFNKRGGRIYMDSLEVQLKEMLGLSDP
jgi:hypothetical protein